MSKFGRLAKLGSLTTRVTGSYLGQQLAGLVQSEEKRKEALDRLHIHNAGRIVENLGALKGAAMKVGQAVAQVADSIDMPADARAMLGKLHDKAEPVPWETVKARIELELGGPVESVYKSIDPSPLGTASLGQVHAATLPDGSDVVVKVLHMGVEDAIHSDLSALKNMLIGGRMLRRSKAEIDSWFDEIDARLAEEIDYENEARNLQTFRRALIDDPDVTVPRVHEGWSTRRVLTMERLHGKPLAAFVATGTPEARQRAGVTLGRVFFDLFYGHRMIQADPHPGNFIFAPDGKIGLLDFGCARFFDLEWVAEYGACAIYTRRNQRELMMQHAVKLGALSERDADAEETLWALGRAIGIPFRDGPFLTGGPDDNAHEQIARVMPKVMINNKLRAPKELVFLHRSLGGIYSLNKQLKPMHDWGEVIERAYAKTLRDTGRRLVEG
ncbi:ABC transporter [Deltaproteobacteria bacterium]|nr:ABC transporter [Deltaproteobacteria bacterium]